MKKAPNPRGLTTGSTSCANGYRLSSVFRRFLACILATSFMLYTFLKNHKVERKSPVFSLGRGAVLRAQYTCLYMNTQNCTATTPKIQGAKSSNYNPCGSCHNVINNTITIGPINKPSKPNVSKPPNIPKSTAKKGS